MEPTFFDVIRERHSVRYYDPEVKISDDELKQMLEEATLAPSSSNLQPWRFLVITDQEAKERLKPIAYGQQQVVDASAVIAVFGDLDSYKQTEKIYNRAVEIGFMDEATKNRMVPRNIETYKNLPPEVARGIVLVDGGLVSMQLMLVAKAHGYDTVPMGGYDSVRFKEEFGVPDRYAQVMLIAVGKAAREAHKSSRLTVDEVTTWNKFE
ncbi:nitroreductase family protein [Gorillibacterium timonense]|uniref:nitroreductase family protein n=1 Tax=Gorillibacterium timonense TaxID=1689269 RepID=UPI00071D1665|nr:nitroreductase family protein [Gorillibacterium timonense]